MSAIKALIKTVEIYKTLGFTSHFWDHGNKLITGINSISKHLGVEYSFSADCLAFSPYYFTKNKKSCIAKFWNIISSRAE